MNTAPFVVTFGEIMTRFSAPGHQRLRQCLPGVLDTAFAGAESNIAASLALLGTRARFVTALPDNALGDACLAHLRGLGIDTSRILRTERGRMPHYFIETGAGPRPGAVLYDRDASSFSLTPGEAYAWDEIFRDASWLVLTGISPALSATAAAATLHAAREAKRRGIAVCCDLNYRSTLWRWEPGTPSRDLARRVMGELMPSVDIVLTNPDQAFDVLCIPWAGAAENDLAAHAAAARRIARAHPWLKLVVFTLRENLSASRNNLGALLHEPGADRVIAAPLGGPDGAAYRPYEIHQIVDRLGAGDAFAAAFIHALRTSGPDALDRALAFATAAACLAHTVPGDVNFVSQAEIERLMAGDGTGRVRR